MRLSDICYKKYQRILVVTLTEYLVEHSTFSFYYFNNILAISVCINCIYNYWLWKK
jgi:hypothetical protein